MKDFLKEYPRLGVIGTYWGDEGKGKAIDVLAEYYDIVVRFCGGNNAGHSVEVGNKEFKFHLLPSGFVRSKTCVLSPGVLFNLQAFLDEISDNSPKISGQLPEIWVDERCPLWTPYHKLFETYLEKSREENPIGTTGRAIGPLKGFHDMREGPIVGHLRNEKELTNTLERLYSIMSPCIWGLGNIPKPSDVARDLINLVQKSDLLNIIIDTGAYLSEAIDCGKRILFEGTQATGLSIEAGTWPYVTSTSSIAAGIPIGTLLAPGDISGTILTMKLFPTRVGEGYMPGELSNRKAIQNFVEKHPELFQEGNAREKFLEQKLREYNQGDIGPSGLAEYITIKASERGVSTGRGRSPGRLDLPWLRYAIRINKPIGLALNHLDIASGLQEIEVVVDYKYKGEILLPGRVPALDLKNVEPIIERWKGWKEDIRGVMDVNKLPNGAREFIERLEEWVKRSVLLIGTGRQRKEIIFRPPNKRFPTMF